MISVISPVYNSAGTLEQLVKKISICLKRISNKFEIILVDDFSEDKSWNKIKKLKKKYHCIRGVRLGKNYGQHQAISVGIKMSTKNILIVMDCDLQDNPKHIIDMYQKYKKNNKSVIIYNLYTKIPLAKRFFSNIFWIILRMVSFKNFNSNFGNFIMIDAKTKKKYLSLKDKTYLYGDLLILNTNFSVIKKDREPSKRKAGTTYNFIKLFNLAFLLIRKYNFISLKLKINNKLNTTKIKVIERI
jgi:dolichol-phosphate mannosyltransferase